MTRRRWIADEVAGDRAYLVGSNAEHLSRVLRARIGQQFEIATPHGIRLGKIVDIEPQRVTLSLTELVRSFSVSRSPVIHLYLAVFKFDRFEWAIEKCTELGVAGIVPVIASRTDAHLSSAAIKRVERWRRIAHEASQQSRREVPPEIAAPEKLHTVIAEALEQRIVLSETESDARLPEAVAGKSELSLAIGPEGGWTDSELSLFAQNHWTAVTLGTTILRAETAAIAAVAVAQQATTER